MILHSKPWIGNSDLTAIEGLLRTGMIAQGAKTAQFETALSEWINAPGGAVAVGSGAAAIVLSLEALGVEAGAEVVAPTYICPKVIEAIVTVGAVPVFCDIGRDWTITPDCVRPVLTEKTRALIIPHFYGIFADIPAFREFNLPIIEDCAQAMDHRGKRTIAGDVAIFSFHPTKLITTGEGGVAVAALPEVAAKMRRIRDGASDFRNARLFSPLPDLASVLGMSQLQRLDEALDRRMSLALRYKAELEAVVPGCFEGYPLKNNVFFRFPLQIDGGVGKFKALFAARGIRVSNGVDALVHRSFGFADDAFRTSVKLFDSTLSLPIYPALTEAEFAACVKAAKEILAPRHEKGRGASDALVTPRA